MFLLSFISISALASYINKWSAMEALLMISSTPKSVQSIEKRASLYLTQWTFKTRQSVLILE